MHTLFSKKLPRSVQRRPIVGQSGVAFVEFALSSLLLFTVILGIIDYSRLIGLRATLLRGAQEGVDVASKIANIDIAPSQFGDAAKRAAFLAAEATVLDAARRFPISTLSQRASAATPRSLVDFIYSFDGAHPDTDAILLRPGDYATTASGYKTCHPTCVSANFCGYAPFVACPAAGASYPQVLRDHPFVVELRAKFRYFMPFFGVTEVSERASAFREQFAKGTLSAPNVITTTSVSVPTTIPPTTSSVSTVSSSVVSTISTSVASTTSIPTASTTSTTTTSVEPASTTSVPVTVTTSTTTSTTTSICSLVCVKNHVMSGCSCICPSGFDEDEDTGICVPGSGG